ncbi:hypothetical protein [Mucilaginibacter sp. L3T2-6]|uniref:hypothetical protein n=1 Tax=Mucilaginibacter sp. L3T2-6 TaxID=3062491 RepID=UPI002674DE6F|nr:hypothetical protein [Mucilaginibacter sp. L3T2-6]MDO3645262.1 hypothetical protein [Mucilaginibacter sp. L3T2-6]MDV6217714.1 hypothetical protein [Mucilaginibacter sp. L3T2-6]
MQVREPSSGEVLKLFVHYIKNAPYPGWVVLIPQNRNVYIYQLDGVWTIEPKAIPPELITVIGNELSTLSPAGKY